MNPSKSSPHPSSSRQSQSGYSENKLKEILHTKLMNGGKKKQSSSSLFWDWRKDVNQSLPPTKDDK